MFALGRKKKKKSHILQIRRKLKLLLLKCIAEMFLHGSKGYMRASLIAHLVKNPPAMQETLVQYLGWEDPVEKG